MTSPVKLYVYDLSNGLARQMSLQLTGRQIDGIWHTSVVVFGKEIFYGQGISITAPGRSHHGKPLQVLDMGATALDEDTFEEYLNEIRGHYTVDKYHLLEFNCNSFTNDCVGFLTGGSIPSWIRDLPSDFLSTPFGAALRPTIDNMYRRSAGAPAHPPPDARTASSILQSVASRAAGSTVPAITPGSALLGSPATAGLGPSVQVCTNLHSFKSLLVAHKAAAVFFTSQTCPPCRVVEPVFETLARDKGSAGVAFVKVDLGAGMGSEVARAWNVRVTPMFLFFLDGKKIHEQKGADASELRTQVDLLIFQAFPPHPHVALALPVTRAISLEPILFRQVPALDTVQAKLLSFVEASSSPSLGNGEKVRVKDTISSTIIPVMKARFVSKTSIPPATIRNMCVECNSLTTTLVKVLPLTDMFPLVDLWRLALLDDTVAAWCAAIPMSNTNTPHSQSDPIQLLLTRAISSQEAGTAAPVPRNFLLTLLRMLANAFSNLALAGALLDPKAPPGSGSRSSSPRQSFTVLLIGSLLHADAAVRTAAASLAFNVAAHCQKPLFEFQRSGRRGEGVTAEGEGDWEVEMVSAVVEAVGRETQNEDVVHRLTASLALFVHLSPFYDSQLKPLLDVLQTRDILLSKLRGGEGGCGDRGVSKKDVRKLVEEVARKLCS